VAVVVAAAAAVVDIMWGGDEGSSENWRVGLFPPQIWREESLLIFPAVKVVISSPPG
jgi:hypothetical protein